MNAHADRMHRIDTALRSFSMTPRTQAEAGLDVYEWTPPIFPRPALWLMGCGTGFVVTSILLRIF